MRMLNKLSKTINGAAEWFIAICLGVMSVVVFAQVVCRLVAGSLPWSEELSRYLMIYMVYIGTAVGIHKGNHIAVEFVMGLCPEKVQKLVEILMDILMMVAFVILCYYGMKIVNITMMQKSPAMQIKMGYVYFSMVLGGALMFFDAFVDMLNAITGYKPEEKGEIAE